MKWNDLKSVMPEIEPQPALGSATDWAMAMKQDPANPGQTVPDTEARARFWAFHAKQQEWNAKYQEPVIVFWPALNLNEGRFRLLAVQVKTMGELQSVKLAIEGGEARWIPMVEVLRELTDPYDNPEKETSNAALILQEVVAGMRKVVTAYDELKEGGGL